MSIRRSQGRRTRTRHKNSTTSRSPKRISKSINQTKLQVIYAIESDKKGSQYVWLHDLHRSFPELSDEKFIAEISSMDNAFMVRGRQTDEHNTYVHDGGRWATVLLRYD